MDEPPNEYESELRYWAWPIVVMFVALVVGITYYNTHVPPEKSPMVACIEQRGTWVSGWRPTTGSCDFTSTGAPAKTTKPPE